MQNELTTYMRAGYPGLAITNNRSTPCPDPYEALQILERMFADPAMILRIKDFLFLAKGKGHCIILLGCRHKLPPELDDEITRIDYALHGSSPLAAELDLHDLDPPLGPMGHESGIRVALFLAGDHKFGEIRWRDLDRVIARLAELEDKWPTRMRRRPATGGGTDFCYLAPQSRPARILEGNNQLRYPHILTARQNPAFCPNSRLD